MSGNNQLTIDFNDWVYDDKERREATSPSTIDTRTIALRQSMAQAPSPLFYISFGSGSSGNCCYLGTRNAGILIDAGILTETVVDTLKENGIKMENIVGICLTHDHGDHVKYAYNIVRKHKHMKVYCTNRVVNGMLRKHNISKRIKDYHSPIFKEIPFKLGDFEITAFDVPHDGDDNMGFFVRHGDKNFVVATDLGAISERARHYISQAHYLMIEANYDKEMLIKGTYPDYLKRRIQTDRGHMDNVETAAFLSEIYTPQLKYIFLCHLSNDNNTPEIALNTISKALKDRGLTIGTAQETIEDRKADVQLMALPRLEPTRWFVFK
ncbi:MAG: MBL fold metallo-hydrolase [Muribaculaceae bacterium]|jgi:phosphoribosyl 1,2-cyclic phosphodiesterase|nr:MBL fold metallo-hydrolase [Muribaculaceae bacterium]